MSSAPSRPQEPRALDLLSPSHFAIPESVVPEVNMQTDENNPDGEQSQQQVAPDLQPQEVDDVRNAGEIVLPPAGAQVALVPDRSGISVNEVQLTPDLLSDHFVLLVLILAYLHLVAN